MFQHLFSSTLIASFVLALSVLQANASQITGKERLHNPKNDTITAVNEEALAALRKIQASMTGITEQGNKYNLYAIKRGKEWTYIILDNITYYSVKQVKGKEEIVENSENTTDMLCMMVKTNLLRKKTRPRNVSGLTLSCYYKFRPEAKKIYKSVTNLERKAKFINDALKEGKGGILKILTS